MTFTAVGTQQTNEPTPANPATFSLTTHGPQGADAASFVLLETVCNTLIPTGVSGGGCTWTKLTTDVTLSTLGAGSGGNVWAGKVVTPGTATVTVSFSGTPGTCRFVSREFSVTSGVIALDVQGSVNGNTSSWASLTPSGTGELYWGYCKNNSSAVAGSTSGFVYEIDSFSNGEGYRLSVPAGAYQPVWGDSTQAAGIMVLITEIPLVFAHVGDVATITTTTPNFSPGAIGDFILAQFATNSATDYVSSISGGGVTTWTPLTSVFHDATNGFSVITYIGVVTATGTNTLTATLSGGSGLSVRGWAQEFSSTAGSYALDTTVNLGAVAAGWPSMTPAGAGELYWAWGYQTGSAGSAGSDPGYTYGTDSNGNAWMYNAACTSSAQAPTFGNSNAHEGQAVLLRAAAAAAPVTVRPVRSRTPRPPRRGKAVGTKAASPRITIVQTATVDSAGGATYAGSFDNPVTVGNTVILAGSGYNSAGNPITSSSPTLGGSTYTEAVLLLEEQKTGAGVNLDAAAWMLPDVQTAGLTSFGLTFTNQTYSGSANGMIAYEVAGLGPNPVLDSSAGANSTIGGIQTSFSSGTTAATQYPDEFVLEFCAQDQGTTTTGQPDVPWNVTSLDPAQNFSAGWQVAATPGQTFSTSFTVNTAASYALGVVTIIPGAPATAVAQGKVIKAPVQRLPRGRGSGTKTPAATSSSSNANISGVAGTVTVTGIAGNITAVTGSPGRTMRARPPAPKRGTGHGTFAVASQPGIVTGTPGQITVTAPAGVIQAYTGIRGRAVRTAPAVPRRGSGRGSRLATSVSAAVTGTPGIITASAPPGTVTAVTGSPGRVIRHRPPAPKKGTGHGIFAVAAIPGTVAGTPGLTSVSAPAGTVTAAIAASVAGPAGKITLTAVVGTVTAVTGSPGRTARSRTAMPPPSHRGHGQHGTIAAVITGPAGTIGVRAPAGTAQAFTGTPGRAARSRTAMPPRPGTGTGIPSGVSAVISGIAGTILVAGPAGGITVTVNGHPGTIAVTGPAGFVVRTPYRYTRWRIPHGFADTEPRSHLVAGSPGKIRVIAPSGTVTAVTGAAAAAVAPAPGRVIKARPHPDRGSGRGWQIAASADYILDESGAVLQDESGAGISAG